MIVLYLSNLTRYHEKNQKVVCAIGIKKNNENDTLDDLILYTII
jgi:hypothetical protein